MTFKSIYKEQTKGYFLLAVLFFNVGFFASINGVLVTYFKRSFDLSYFVANIIPFVFFLGYFFMSAPFGLITHKYSYKRALNISLVLGSIGCLLFMMGMYINNFLVILAALFFIASFVTGLEVAANPLVVTMGPNHLSSQRLTFVHFLDSVGTITGPQFASFIFFFSVTLSQIRHRITFFYLLLSLIFLGFIWLVSRLFRNQKVENESVSEVDQEKYPGSLWQSKQLMLGIVAIFIYVGCEVSIANFLIAFAMSSQTAGLDLKSAAIYLSLYWCGQMIGRLIAAFFLGRTNTHFPLAFCGFLAMALVSGAMLLHGPIRLYLITLVGLANSIMYPSIFSIAVENLGPLKAKASGLLHMGIVGGAIVPLLQGILADHIGVVASYWLPAMLYVFICFYALNTRPRLVNVEAYG